MQPRHTAAYDSARNSSNPILHKDMRAHYLPFAGTVKSPTIHKRVVKNPQPIFSYNKIDDSLEELSGLIARLECFRPLRKSQNLHNLAQSALISLKNRQSENIKSWAAKLADDIAGAID